MSPTIHETWLWILAAAAPIAGLVGFALNLWQLKRARLENEKLRLEIEVLRAAQAAKEQRIAPVTLEEVKVYGGWRMPRMPSPYGIQAAPTLGGWLAIAFILILLLYWLFKWGIF